MLAFTFTAIFVSVRLKTYALRSATCVLRPAPCDCDLRPASDA